MLVYSDDQMIFMYRYLLIAIHNFNQSPIDEQLVCFKKVFPNNTPI